LASTVDKVESSTLRVNGINPFLLHGYSYPSPYLFLGINSQQKSVYLAVCLASCTAWTHYVHATYATGSLPRATRAQWRKWLASSNVADKTHTNRTLNSAPLMRATLSEGGAPVSDAVTVASKKPAGQAAARSKARRKEAKHIFGMWMPDVQFPVEGEGSSVWRW
jgi:hypothetical protein